MKLLFADIDIGALVPIVVIVLGVIYNLIRKMTGGDAEEQERARQRERQLEEQKRRQAAAGAPAKREPMLPYEDLVDQMFGPYIESRKREYQGRHEEKEDEDDEEPMIRILDEKPAPVAAKPTAELRVIQEMPPPVAIPGAIGDSKAATVRGRGRRRSLDRIVFRNPRLSEGARLVLAAEILNRPRPGRFPRVP